MINSFIDNRDNDENVNDNKDLIDHTLLIEGNK